MEPTELRFHKEHEWVRVEGKEATVGISDFAQDALGDVVFIEAPKVGITVSADQEMGEVESTKATSTIFTPLSGKVLRVNAELQDHPELVNQDPYGKGWIAVLEMSNPSEVEQLMTAGQYEEFLKTQSS